MHNFHCKTIILHAVHSFRCMLMMVLSTCKFSFVRFTRVDVEVRRTDVRIAYPNSVNAMEKVHSTASAGHKEKCNANCEIRDKKGNVKKGWHWRRFIDFEITHSRLHSSIGMARNVSSGAQDYKNSVTSHIHYIEWWFSQRDRTMHLIRIDRSVEWMFSLRLFVFVLQDYDAGFGEHVPSFKITFFAG